MALDFTFLTEEQIWGDDDNGNGQLEVIKRYGTAVAPTDLAVLLGGWMTGEDERTSEDELTCASWSVSAFGNDYVRCVHPEGDEYWDDPQGRRISVRPALSPSVASQISPFRERTLESGIRSVEYGEYPQAVADKPTSERLERLLKSQSLHSTERNYTFDSVDLHDYDTAFKAISYPEYELDGKRYIRIPGGPWDKRSKLSTGEQVEVGKPYWVEVQPIEWLVDPTGVWVSKKCLFAGIQFNSKSYYGRDFLKTFMKRYLDTYFAKEIGHEEIVAQKEKQKHDKVMTGLSAQLGKVSSTDVIKERLKAAEKGRTALTEPKRMDEAARIHQVRQARDIIFKALQEAKDAGDEKLMREILKMTVVQIYDGRYQIQQEKFQRRRTERRAEQKQTERR